MNKYQKILEQETGKEYTKAMMKTARAIVKASQASHPTRKQQELLDNWYTCSSRSRNEMLAITAVFAEMNKGKATVNFDQIAGRLFTREDFRELEDSYLVQVFAVAQPHQFCFIA